MFQIFGDEIYDSGELADILSNEKGINVISDLTKSTARDDAIALKCSVCIDCITNEKIDMTDDRVFMDVIQRCEGYIDDIIVSLKIKYSLHKIRAYKYDELSNSIIFIFCVMYIETARKKLNDMFKRLLKNNG